MEFVPEFLNDVSLRNKTWLGVGGGAQYFFEVYDHNILPSLIAYCKDHNIDVFVLGEGSNVVISDIGFKGLVIRLRSKDITVVSELDNEVVVHADAGMIWDDFVSFCVAAGWWGVENMSLIPGTVGACPVQNVGAYGQDCSGIIYSVEVYDTHDEVFKTILKSDCHFGFRSSIFNTQDIGRYIITGVNFKLSKISRPNLTRPEIRAEIERISPSDANLQTAIRDTIIKLRTNGKALPNSPSMGNAGTFFRTTVVPLSVLLLTFFKTLINLGFKPAVVSLLFGVKYRDSDGYRVPSRRLIDACGLGGTVVNSVSLYDFNSAVLVTDKTKNPSSKEIIEMIKIIRKGVYDKTGFKVPIEPTLIGFTKDEIKDIFS